MKRSTQSTLVFTAMIALLLIGGVVMSPGCTPQQIADYKAGARTTQAEIQRLESVIAQGEIEIEVINTAIDGEIDKAKAQAQALPDGPDKDELLKLIDELGDQKAQITGDLGQVVAKAREELTKADALLGELNANLEEAQTTGEVIRATGGGVAGILPPPWNLVLAGALGVWGTIERVRAGKAQKETKTQAGHIEFLNEQQTVAWDQVRAKESALESVIEAIETVKRENGGVVDFTNPAVRASIRSAMSTEARRAVDIKRKAMLNANPYGSTQSAPQP